MENGFIDKGIDKIFSLSKSQILLLGIIFLGLILRIVAAINLGVNADDMHFVTHAIGFLEQGRLITYDQSSGLWFAFTSLMYSFLGETQLASRLAAIIFGTFSIISLYLLVKEFFDYKIAMLSAFILAIAPFHLKWTIAEMDVMAMFFVLTSTFLFVKATKLKKTTWFALSGISLGLAIYTKVYPLLFIPSLLLIFMVFIKKFENKKLLTQKNIKFILTFLVCIFIFTIPALTHSYLLYKDKGFLDLQFTRTLELGKNNSAEYYAWDAQFDAKNDWKGLVFGNSSNYGGDPTPTILVAIKFILFGSPAIFLLGLGGIFMIWQKNQKRKYLYFFILMILFVLPFLASIILLPKHFLFLEIFLIPLASYFLVEIASKKEKIRKTNTLKILVIVILVFSLYWIGTNNSGTAHIYGKSSIDQMISFKNEETTKQSTLLVADNRFYRGRINWVMQDRPYLEAGDFINFLNNQESIPGETVLTNVYFFECATDDCGWGTIKDQPEVNNSMESLTEFFATNGNLVKTIEEPSKRSNYFPVISSKDEAVKIYYLKMPIKVAILQEAAKPKNWFLYDIGYIPKQGQFDSYTTYTNLDDFLDRIAHLIVKISLGLTFITLIFLAYLLLKDENFNNSSNL